MDSDFEVTGYYIYTHCFASSGQTPRPRASRHHTRHAHASLAQRAGLRFRARRKVHDDDKQTDLPRRGQECRQVPTAVRCYERTRIFEYLVIC